MHRLLVLYEQAKILRALAESFDISSIKDELLTIAKKVRGSSGKH